MRASPMFGPRAAGPASGGDIRPRPGRGCARGARSQGAVWCSNEMARDGMIAYARAPRADAQTSTIRSSERRNPPYYKHFLGIFWTLVDQGAISLGTFLLNIQLGRQLPAPEYGTFALLWRVYFIVQRI